jgi:hypothetical protein
MKYEEEKMFRKIMFVACVVVLGVVGSVQAIWLNTSCVRRVILW